MSPSYESSEIAECVGLWLAEGDNKTIREITFTNNSIPLIYHFHRTLKNIFKSAKFRLYIYSPKEKTGLRFKNCIVREYTDKRASKPYYILRYASTSDLVTWKCIIANIIKQKKYYSDVLRGFFAGEGNIKTGAHSNRTIRIAQKNPIKIIDAILSFLKIKYKFSYSEHAYTITGYDNWKIFYKYKIFTLHTEKKKKFLIAWKSYKEIHYPANFIKNNLLQHLSKPKTTYELSKIFNREFATLQDILCKMKIEGKVLNYKSGSYNYWINSNANKVIISKRKAIYLSLLKNPSRVCDIANKMNVDWKAAKKRLEELEKLYLVKHESGVWSALETNKEVVVL